MKYKTQISQVRKQLKNDDMQVCLAKLLLECWNAETPHFGGCGPHRYDGTDKFCAYCNRPKNWKPQNAGYLAGQVVYGDE